MSGWTNLPIQSRDGEKAPAHHLKLRRPLKALFVRPSPIKVRITKIFQALGTRLHEPVNRNNARSPQTENPRDAKEEDVAQGWKRPTITLEQNKIGDGEGQNNETLENLRSADAS